ncbi:hypothetical protein EDD21DRAFT_214839 [Dissophora ornata]|nr:hypothetical protein EDD21DRAFT_214839 [Dissophora ornata]
MMSHPCCSQRQVTRIPKHAFATTISLFSPSTVPHHMACLLHILCKDKSVPGQCHHDEHGDSRLFIVWITTLLFLFACVCVLYWLPCEHRMTLHMQEQGAIEGFTQM